MVRPGAREMITWSGLNTSLISANTASKYWGFTASKRYFTWAAQSAFEAAWGTPVCPVTRSIFSLWADENTISAGS